LNDRPRLAVGKGGLSRRRSAIGSRPCMTSPTHQHVRSLELGTSQPFSESLRFKHQSFAQLTNPLSQDLVVHILHPNNNEVCVCMLDAAFYKELIQRGGESGIAGERFPFGRRRSQANRGGEKVMAHGAGPQRFVSCATWGEQQTSRTRSDTLTRHSCDAHVDALCTDNGTCGRAPC
jgi:hypothetical protein